MPRSGRVALGDRVRRGGRLLARPARRRRTTARWLPMSRAAPRSRPRLARGAGGRPRRPSTRRADGHTPAGMQRCPGRLRIRLAQSRIQPTARRQPSALRRGPTARSGGPDPPGRRPPRRPHPTELARGWLGWQGVPVLYRTAAGDPDVENAPPQHRRHDLSGPAGRGSSAWGLWARSGWAVGSTGSRPPGSG